MLSKRFLRILIVAELVVNIVGVIVAFSTESSLPEPLRQYQEAQSQGDVTPKDLALGGVGILFTIATFVASIGLFVLWRPARPLYLITAVVGVLLTPVLGPHVMSGWAELFGNAAELLCGVVIAVVYFSPLKELYERQSGDS